MNPSRTHRIAPTERPQDASRLSNRRTLCGIVGQIDKPRGCYEYTGGTDEMTDTIGDHRYEITDYDPSVDCKRCLAVMKRASKGDGQ